MNGIDLWSLTAHALPMSRKEQGKLLREWRRYMSTRRGKKITLMSLADEVAELAEREGYDRSSRRVPGSHASMTRWELGNVDQSLVGLQLIATLYGVGVMDLMKSPPDATPAAPAVDDDAVQAFRDFLASRKRG